MGLPLLHPLRTAHRRLLTPLWLLAMLWLLPTELALLSHRLLTLPSLLARGVLAGGVLALVALLSRRRLLALLGRLRVLGRLATLALWSPSGLPLLSRLPLPPRLVGRALRGLFWRLVLRLAVRLVRLVVTWIWCHDGTCRPVAWHRVDGRRFSGRGDKMGG